MRKSRFPCGNLFLRFRAVLVGMALAGFVSDLCGQTELAVNGCSVAVTLPGMDALRVQTIGHGTSGNDWFARLEEEQSLGEGGTQFVFAFNELAKLTLKRNLHTTSKGFSSEDSWTSDQPIKGYLCFEISIPFSRLNGITISTPFGKVTAGELTDIWENKSFLRHSNVHQFTLMGDNGQSLSMSVVQPTTFEILSNVKKATVLIRVFWTPPAEPLANGSLSWKIETNPPATQ
jgi:hypothetical protein